MTCKVIDGAFTAQAGNARTETMEELIRTNDPVVLSFAEALLRDAGIAAFVADTNMSILDGSLGILPRRLMGESERILEARRLLTDADMRNLVHVLEEVVGHRAARQRRPGPDSHELQCGPRGHDRDVGT